MALAGIFALAHLLDRTELIGTLSRWLIITLSQLAGFTSQDLTDELVIGHIHIPWTRDCSGMNALILLWMLTLWVNRLQLLTWSTLARLVACLPLALLVNLVRLVCVTTYRMVMYPDWETPQLHYFIGFVCLIPCVPLLVNGAAQRSRSFWLELLFMATLLALVSPLVFLPGGTVILLACLLLLPGISHQETSSLNVTVTLLWLLVAVLIAASATESLWIAWLLVSPLFTPQRTYRQPAFWILLSGTVAILATNPNWQWLLLIAAGLHITGLYRGSAAETTDATATRSARQHLVASLASIMILAPFVLPLLAARGHSESPPPRGVMAREIAFNSYQVRLPGQAADVASYWFGPFGDGRHHALTSCMKFRGVELSPAEGESRIFVTEQRWMTEYFIHDGKLLSGYPAYLLSSFMPFSPAGVHLILEAPLHAVGKDFFKAESDRIADAVARLSLASNG